MNLPIIKMIVCLRCHKVWPEANLTHLTENCKCGEPIDVGMYFLDFRRKAQRTT